MHGDLSQCLLKLKCALSEVGLVVTFKGIGLVEQTAVSHIEFTCGNILYDIYIPTKMFRGTYFMLDLKGKTTDGGWLIGDRVTFVADHTGGYFSCCFNVTKGGSRAFLKALDIEKFDISQVLGLLASFEYETGLVAFCNDKHLRRVVLALETGQIERDATVAPVLRMVPYIVFEMADGDIRSSVDVSSTVTAKWRFHVLHQTTLALLQLHGQSIAHQDIKPSNVLRFGESNIKLGDLGRSSLRGRPAPHDHLAQPGASNYAPFEQRYSSLPTDWVERRLSTDVFHLGCLTVFSFTNICFPAYVMQRLADPYHPTNWGGTYEHVMPHVQAALVDALSEISTDFPLQFRTDLTEIVLDLCNPDPRLRGRAGLRKGATNGGLLWLQRYASRFSVLEKKAGIRPVISNA